MSDERVVGILVARTEEFTALGACLRASSLTATAFVGFSTWVLAGSLTLAAVREPIGPNLLHDGGRVCRAS